MGNFGNRCHGSTHAATFCYPLLRHISAGMEVTREKMGNFGNRCHGSKHVTTLLRCYPPSCFERDGNNKKEWGTLTTVPIEAHMLQLLLSYPASHFGRDGNKKKEWRILTTVAGKFQRHSAQFWLTISKRVLNKEPKMLSSLISPHTMRNVKLLSQKAKYRWETAQCEREIRLGLEAGTGNQSGVLLRRSLPCV